MPKRNIFILSLLSLLSSCIENDIPYPLVEAEVKAIEVQYQTEAPTINKTARTITLHVDDRARLSSIKITKLQFSDAATLAVTGDRSYPNFPSKSFESADRSGYYNIDFTRKVTFRFHIYQDYDWTVDVKQNCEPDVKVTGCNKVVTDTITNNMIIYVNEDTDLTKVAFETFRPLGQHCDVQEQPEGKTYDCSHPLEFHIRRYQDPGVAPEPYRLWTVFVYRRNPESSSVKVQPLSSRAIVTFNNPSAVKVAIEYRRTADSDWKPVPASDIESQGGNYTATLRGLTPGQSYAMRVFVNDLQMSEQSFTTAPAPELPFGSFDAWHKVGRLWNPWAEDTDQYWDTGNRGATTVGESNVYPIDDTCSGSGQAVSLDSKYIVIKFAAGSIFTGKYVETDGTNGVLEFGRPFAGGYPTALRVNYKFHSETINKSADKDMEYLKGRPDSCQIYIALTNRTYPIRTRPSARQLFDPNDEGVIGYGQITQGDDVTEWTRHDIQISYRRYDEAPKYIIVVASSSKFGDYFTGGNGTRLWLDNFELIYD